MSAPSIQSAASSENLGGTLTRIGMCSQRVCVRLDNAISRKGLDAQQAAFAIRKYKSHRRVGLPADIITAIAQDAQRAS